MPCSDDREDPCVDPYVDALRALRRGRLIQEKQEGARAMRYTRPSFNRKEEK